MNWEEFNALLMQKKIDPQIVSLNNSTSEGYNIRSSQHHWETFVRERGVEYDCMGFPSESDALQYLYSVLITLYPPMVDAEATL